MVLEPINRNRPVAEIIGNSRYPLAGSTFGINQDQPSQLQHLINRPPPPPHTATASIFAPRTKDMNKGFLTFSEDQPGLTSKFKSNFIFICIYAFQDFYAFSIYLRFLKLLIWDSFKFASFQKYILSFACTASIFTIELN